MVSQNIIHGDSLLQAVDLFKEYTNGVRTVPVLRGINLAIAKGEIVVIVGASGAGKSTLLHILGILDTPTSGSVLYNGMNLTRLSEKKTGRYAEPYFRFCFSVLPSPARLYCFRECFVAEFHWIQVFSAGDSNEGLYRPCNFLAGAGQLGGSVNAQAFTAFWW